MRCVLVAATAVGMLASGAAHAEPGLANEVYGAAVQRGKTEIEGRAGVLTGGGAGGEGAFIGEVAYGVTDWWRPTALFEVTRGAGGDGKLDSVALENVFDITPTRGWPVHFGAYAEYEINAQDGPDKIELKLLAEHVSGPLRLRLNLIGDRHVGAGASNDWEYGYAAQGVWTLTDDIGLGVEGFGDAGTDSVFGNLGDHAQYWGPIAQFEAVETRNGDLEVQLGYLFGSGAAAADGQFRVRLEWER